MSERTCSIDDCVGPHRAKGLCSTHYNRARAGRHKKFAVTCSYCGAALAKYKSGERRPFCDYTCRDLYSMGHGIGAWKASEKKPKSKTEPRDLRSPLRRCIEDGDHVGVIEAIRLDCNMLESGCWEWQRRRDVSGYPVVAVRHEGKRQYYLVHRLVLEAHLRQPLGSQAAHHCCANTSCVNPAHLQPVTHRENAAEMMERKYYRKRIAELEDALAAISPGHPALSCISVPRIA